MLISETNILIFISKVQAQPSASKKPPFLQNMQAPSYSWVNGHQFSGFHLPFDWNSCPSIYTNKIQGSSVGSNLLVVPSFTHSRGCVTYWSGDWRSRGWVGCEWQIWLRCFAGRGKRGGTGGWERGELGAGRGRGGELEDGREGKPGEKVSLD